MTCTEETGLLEDSSSESGNGERSGEEEEEEKTKNLSTYSVKLSLSWFQLHVAPYGLSSFYTLSTCQVAKSIIFPYSIKCNTN